MSMKNSSDTIGNRTHDLPDCSAIPTAPPRAPPPQVWLVRVQIRSRTSLKVWLLVVRFELNWTLLNHFSVCVCCTEFRPNRARNAVKYVWNLVNAAKRAYISFTRIKKFVFRFTDCHKTDAPSSGFVEIWQTDGRTSSAPKKKKAYFSSWSPIESVRSSHRVYAFVNDSSSDTGFFTRYQQIGLYNGVSLCLLWGGELYFD